MMNKKQLLLETAAQMIREDGIQQLSLERLAARVGITKAGVLYHFETKDNLLRQMNELAITKFETRIHHHMTDGPYPFTRAYAQATLDYLDAARIGLSAVFISSQEDASGAIWNEAARRWDERFLADGTDPRVLELRLLCDGFWFALTYGYSDAFKDEAARLLRQKCDALEQAGG